MTPLQMLRAALHALCDPVAGLPKGLAMEPLSLEQLTEAVREAAPVLISPAAAAPHHGVFRCACV